MTRAGLTVSSDGVLPDGSRSWTIDTERSKWVLPDWTIVDSPGRVYTRWGAGGRAGMELTPSVRAGASIPDTRSYASGSEVSVRVWRTWNDYRDVTEMLDADNGMPIVKKAENSPGSLSLALDADWETPSANPLSESFAGWQYHVASSGDDSPGPIRPGYYVTIHALEGTAWVPVAEGWITTLQPEAGRLRVECADGLAVLAHQGATLRRNYYAGHPKASGDGSIVSGKLRGSLSAMEAGGVVDTESMQWLTPQTWTDDDTIDGSATGPFSGHTPYGRYGDDYEYARWEWDAPAEMMLRRVSIHVYNNDSLTSTSAYVVLVTKRWVMVSDTLTIGGSFSGWKNFDFDTPRLIAEGEEVQIVLVGGHSLHLTLYSGTVADESPFRGGIWWYGGDWYKSKCPDWDIVAYLPRKASGTVMSGYVEITDIEGWAVLDDPTLADPPDGRFVYAYYTAEEGRDEIMSALAMSHDALPFVAGTTDATLGVYRIGGGVMQQYLQRIADVMGGDGQRRTITARGYTVMAIASGVRHERTDAPTLRACWRKDGTGVPSDAVEFVSFAPRMTLKGKPSLAVVRGSWAGDTAMPMMVAVEAEGSTAARGLRIERATTDSEASDVASAMRAAWASLNADGLDVWEGVLVLPGFLPGLIERSGEHAGAGAVIELYDERYGLAGYRVLVKEVRADWGKRTTEVVVTSYSPAYASTVPDTAAAVQMAGDLSTGSGMLYRMQYARAVADAPTADMSTMEVATATGEWWECDDVSVGYTPTRAIVTARIVGDASHNTDASGKYAIARVRVGTSVLTIDPYRRPDLYTGQVLIIQADYPRARP